MNILPLKTCQETVDFPDSSLDPEEREDEFDSDLDYDELDDDLDYDELDEEDE